ncbi:MAG: hypothetical protein COY80_00920 [Candidatus Pacebacteria bacterium CG_4_10_14_0_8_um_filter_42_14]|nr:MAG: hypothetical protein COY80_00920 [Candidatus Pacebacteria bacterium CG_4_10_14_0_8_um_filter_42_14]
MTKNEFPRPRRRTIDQEAISHFLTSLGFQTERITQEWRHLTAFGTFEGKEAVFKLATTLATARYTHNEFNWNTAIHLTPEDKRPNFTVPENFSSGHYGKLFYFIAQRFMEEPFAQAKAPLSNDIKRRIKQIAAMTREIELLSIPSDSEFAKTHALREQISIGQKLLKSATEWASQVPRNLDTFLKVIEDSKDTLRTCPAHGDFVIRQMYDIDGKIGLIDGEHAGLEGAYHYDVAQFYIRLRNDHNAPGEAKQYLHDFYDLLSPEDKDSFWQELKPSLIQRYIGDLWGAAKDAQKLDELKQLGQEIINDKIL